MSYQIIYADPPWQYRDTASAGKRGASHKYDVMTLDAIKALPVRSLCAPAGAVLFLWGTFPMMPEAMSVIDAWGFTYKTAAFIWRKTTKTGKDAFGMGNWTRANPEPCFLAVRGKHPRRQSRSVRQMQAAPVMRHSQKPHLFRELIVELMELFAREAAPGWDAWGNEVESTPTVKDILNKFTE